MWQRARPPNRDGLQDRINVEQTRSIWRPREQRAIPTVATVRRTCARSECGKLLPRTAIVNRHLMRPWGDIRAVRHLGRRPLRQEAPIRAPRYLRRLLDGGLIA